MKNRDRYADVPINGANPMTDVCPLQLIRDLYAAFSAGDVPGVLGRMSPTIVWNEADDFPYADGNPYIGPQRVAEGVFARCIGEWDGFGVETDAFHHAGDTVVVTGRYRGVFKATGKAQNTQFVHVWKVKDGLAAGFQQYANTLHVARVMGG